MAFVGLSFLKIAGIAALLPALLISADGQTRSENTVAVADTIRAGSDALRPVKMLPESELENATRVYRIGVEDVLRIELIDVPGVPRTVAVQSDGTVSYPLAGVGIAVAGKTATEAEAMIAEAVKTVTKSGVRIRVTGFRSHNVSIWGLVGEPGEHSIQRDAVPFFVIRAMTQIDPRSDRVRIVRAGSEKLEEIKLGDPLLDSKLVYPGDSVEFAAGATGSN